MKRAVIGIGNPGEEYEGTYHNLGAAFVTWMAGEGAAWTSRKNVRYAKSGDTVYALTTGYMNESGRGVRELLDFLKIEPGSIAVAHDDTDQALGRVRVRRGGGSAGHKGITSIVESLGTNDFWRIKIGARPEGYTEPVRVKAGGFVLSRLTEEERDNLYGVVFPEASKLASKVIENETPSGPERTSVTGS